MDDVERKQGMKEIGKPFAVLVTLLIALAVSNSIGRQPTSDTTAEVAMGVGEPRSSEWPKVRATFIKEHPECAACGYKGTANQVHHVSPFHLGAVNERGETLELDPKNLITLCGPGNRNHHLDIGHGGSFTCRNPNVREDAERFRQMRKDKICD